MKFATVEDAKASVAKIKKSGRSHAHKIQAAIAMEQRARVMGKAGPAAVYRKFINAMKKKTKAMRKEMVTTANIPNPADTAMGPRFKPSTVHDRRKKKGGPLLLKRFRDYYQEKGIE